jgi:hypothetical protein
VNHERASFTAPGVDTWSFTPKCVDCHDPHGDGSNVKFMHNDLWDNGSSATFVPTSYSTIGNTNVVFTAYTTGQNATGTAYADTDTPWSSTCQECHETADADMTSYKDGVRADIAPHPASPGDCSGCHKHSSGFKPSGCSAGGTSCHGGGTTGSVEKNFWPDTGLKTDNTTASSNQPGAHLTHITVIARRLYNLDITGLLNDATSGTKQKAICEYCHQAATNDADHGVLANVPADVFQLTYRKMLNGAADGNATFTTAADSCQLTDCHNSKDTNTTSRNWYSGAVTACIMCHTADGSANNPASGVHRVPSTTAVAHDDSFGPQPGNSGSTCTTCHTLMPSLTTTQTNAHINGTFTANNFTSNTTDNEYWVNLSLYTEGTTLTGATAGYCSGTAAYGANCHDGVGENTSTTVWKRRWSSNALLTTGAECEGCHGGFNATDWTFGVTTGRTADGNVDHNFNYGGTAGSQVIGKHSNATGNTTKCNLCHVYLHANYPNNGNTRIGWKDNAANNSTLHGNGSIEMNSTVGYSRTVAPAFGCSGATACHGSNNNIFVLENSGWTLATIAGAAGSCDACHGDGSGTLQVVWPTGNASGKKTVYGSHLQALTNDTLSGSTDWNTQCNKCHTTHSGTVVIPLPPASWNNNNGNTAANMQTILGINYTANGGIHLGGTSTTGTTEAEVCWNCHYATGNGGFANSTMNEFKVNNNTTTGAVVYNYGSLSGFNWTTATWSSAVTGTPSFAYKNGAIQSTHSANFTGGTAALSGSAYAYTETKDAVGTIRCTYCHDVHDMNRANGTSIGGVVDTFSGNPYLRGSYRGNPYKEDGAPRSGMTYANLNDWGVVPRGTSNNSQSMGGYWIDQNSSSPTSAWTSAQFGGLCFLCHGTNMGTMDWKTNENLWIGTANGHANSVKSATGPGTNIFDARGGNSARSNQPLQHYQGIACPATSGFRLNNTSAFRLLPYIYSGGAMTDRGTHYCQDEYGVDELGTILNSNYHKFSCSKCHNPHASRLPKLMITNCLDTKKNTWDNTFQLNTTTSGVNSSRSLSNWSSAVNCHRLGGVDPTDARADVAGMGSGWNKVTPW